MSNNILILKWKFCFNKFGTIDQLSSSWATNKVKTFYPATLTQPIWANSQLNDKAQSEPRALYKYYSMTRPRLRSRSCQISSSRSKSITNVNVKVMVFFNLIANIFFNMKLKVKLKLKSRPVKYKYSLS